MKKMTEEAVCSADGFHQGDSVNGDEDGERGLNKGPNYCTSNSLLPGCCSDVQ